MRACPPKLMRHSDMDPSGIAGSGRVWRARSLFGVCDRPVESLLARNGRSSAPLQRPLLHLSGDAVPVAEPVCGDFDTKIHGCVIGVDRHHASHSCVLKICAVCLRREDRSLVGATEGSRCVVGNGGRHGEVRCHWWSQWSSRCRRGRIDYRRRRRSGRSGACTCQRSDGETHKDQLPAHTISIARADRFI